MVQVRVRREGGEDGTGRVADLHLERVVRGGGGRLGGIDVEVERQRRRRLAARDRDLLVNRVGVRGAVAVQPRVPRSAVRRLGRRVADDARAGDPR